MTSQTPTVDQYSLTVDADDVVRETLSNVGDTERGQAFEDAMSAVRCADSRTTTFILPASVNLDLDSYAPDNDLTEINDWRNVLTSLEDSGFAKLARVLTEDSDGSYASDDITVTAVTVPEGFKVVEVRYDYAPMFGLGRIPVTGGTVGETWEVPAGTYIVGETGNYARMDTVAVAYLEGTDHDAEDLFFTVAENEEFGVSRASSGCDADETHQWEAEGGSWRFRGEYAGGEAPDYDFDDAEDFSDDTHACPVEGCTGRVGYTVY